jgi:murein endopeptidase
LGRVWIQGAMCLGLCFGAQVADASEIAAPVFAQHQLSRADGLLVRWDPANSWGSALLVDTVEQVSERMAWLLPEADPLMVGDVSRHGGGHLFGHKTHDVGLDADLGLFVADGRQPSGGFVNVRPTDLDVASTWVLVRELLETGNVQFILLDEHLIAALRAHVRNDVGLDPVLVDQIFPEDDSRIPWDTHGVVRHAPNHRSHLHVRVARHDDV